MTQPPALLKTIALLALLLTTAQAIPYSFQTHEQLIDLTWKSSIRPLLLRRFPTLTEPQLQEAHAYAYGGCAIQDLGYYPFGKPFFSDLMHYVRSGDFIRSLLRNARTADELAFAIGALSHYVADNIGHADAVNLSVPIEFPKLKKNTAPTSTTAKTHTPTSAPSSPSTSTKSANTASPPRPISNTSASLSPPTCCAVPSLKPTALTSSHCWGKSSGSCAATASPSAASCPASRLPKHCSTKKASHRTPQVRRSTS